MKNLFKFAIAAFAVVSVVSACTTDGDAVDGYVAFEVDDSVDGYDVLEAYTSNVVITRYENLAEKSLDLYDAVKALKDNESNPTLIAEACSAWVATRLAWERTEAYLFGPVDSYKIDPGIDSWPLALSDLAEFVVDWTEYSIQNDNGEKKGFHTIEFLLFEDGESKSSLAQFTSDLVTDSKYGFTSLSAVDVQLFLEAITKELCYNTVLLVAEWDNIDNDVVETAYNSYGISVKTNNGGGYIDDFINAGVEEDGELISSFSTLSDALSVILESAGGIADEVGAVKINDPYVSKSVLDVESWFSWNSVYDFTDNIIGIKEAYYGKLFDGISTEYSVSAFGAAESDSISAYVASGSEALDTAVKEAIEEAISKVSALPYPFRNAISNSEAYPAIDDAMEACENLLAALELAQMAVNDGYYIEE